MEKKDWFNVILSLVLGVNVVLFGVLNYGINQSSLAIQSELRDLTVASIRADLNVFVEPIDAQNWDFVTGGVNVKVNGELTNEGSRTTMIKRIELYAVFPYPDSGEEIFTICCNLTNFNIANLTIEENEQYEVSIDCFIRNHLVVNNQTGKIMQIGSSMPNKVGLAIWHNDGIDMRINSGETS